MTDPKIAAKFFAAFLFLATSTAAQDANTLKEQARAVFKSGDYRAAIVAYKKAEAAASRQYGANDQKTDIIVNELAMSHYKQGEYREAIPLYERVLKNTEARVGPNHFEVGTCLNNLGLVYDDLGDNVKA